MSQYVKAKTYKITAPAMKHRDGWKCPKTELRVTYYESRIGVPWKTMRPLIACAFRHVQREGFNDLKLDFIDRNRRNASKLFVHKSKRDWWGRNMGIRSRVFVGPLHDEPKLETYDRFDDMPEYWVKDWREHLVGIVAHELWHRWQPGTGKAAEMVCELVEIDAIDAYRKLMKYTFTPPTKPENENTDTAPAPDALLGVQNLNEPVHAH